MRSRNPSPNTHGHTAHPSQEWRGTSGARTQTHTHPNTPARSGRAQPKPEPKHTQPHRTRQPGEAEYKRSTHKDTHTPQHPKQEWRGAAETQVQAHTPTPHTPARSGGVQTEHAPEHTHTPQHPSQEWRGAAETRAQADRPSPRTPARSGGYKQSAHTAKHASKPQPGMSGCKPKPKPSRTHHKPQPGKEGGNRKHTHARPQPGLEGLPRRPDPNTSATQQ